MVTIADRRGASVLGALGGPAALLLLLSFTGCHLVFPYQAQETLNRDARPDAPRLDLGPAEDTAAPPADGAPPACRPPPALPIPDGGLNRCWCDTKNPCPGALLWPVAAETLDGRDCTSGFTKVFPATGPGAANWFNYKECLSWKDYEVPAGCGLIIRYNGDCCGTCSLNQIHFDVLEVIDGLPLSRPLYQQPLIDAENCINDGYYAYTAVLVPQQGVQRIRIQARDGHGFYACVFVLTP